MSEFFQFGTIIIRFFYYFCALKIYDTDTSIHAITYVKVNVRHISDTEHNFGQKVVVTELLCHHK
jgi:C4-dicarboxylate-specific signal transduction histidine kinase